MRRYIEKRYKKLEKCAIKFGLEKDIASAKTAVQAFNAYVGYNPLKWSISFIPETRGHDLRKAADVYIEWGWNDLIKSVRNSHVPEEDLTQTYTTLGRSMGITSSRLVTVERQLLDEANEKLRLTENQLDEVNAKLILTKKQLDTANFKIGNFLFDYNELLDKFRETNPIEAEKFESALNQNRNRM